MGKSVIILGAGPSGMIAAHAASQSGYEVKIYDKDPDKSRKTSGLFYLHTSCDLLIDSTVISQAILGAKGASSIEIAQRYSQKVYGKDLPSESLSITKVLEEPVVRGYNAIQAIERLWDLYGHCVEQYEVKNLFQVEKNFPDTKVISTIPAPILFPLEKFESVQSWVRVGKAPEKEAFIFYSISPNHKWDRTSALFGVFVQEFPFSVLIESKEGYETIQLTKVIGGFQPKSTNEVVFVGRYGAWDKKILVSDVYTDVLKWLKNG